MAGDITNGERRMIPLRLADETRERIEKVRGEVSREEWIRGAIELRLDGRITAPVNRNSRRARSSAEARRNVRPQPKGGNK